MSPAWRRTHCAVVDLTGEDEHRGEAGVGVRSFGRASGGDDARGFERIDDGLHLVERDADNLGVGVPVGRGCDLWVDAPMTDSEPSHRRVSMPRIVLDRRGRLRRRHA